MVTILIAAVLQTVSLAVTAVACYRAGLRAGFARGENHGIHGVMRVLREVMEEAEEDGRRTH
jgi:hypothetical protein